MRTFHPKTIGENIISADDHSHHGGNAPTGGSFWSSRAFLVSLGFAALAVVLL
jgi:hypothetical protein